MDIRNIAIIAHVDHGKTTLVDGLLRQSGAFRANQSIPTCVMDSNDQEKERGITILAKNTSVRWQGTKINIIDTPGHADFGGEVERVLRMADGVLLLVDAYEGPMPQTRFVLRKAMLNRLQPIVVVNKIDRPEARPMEVLNEIYDLFIDLEADDQQLEFPVIYASGREGYARREPGDADTDLVPLFEDIVKFIPAPKGDPAAPLQVQCANIDYNDYVGRIAIGRIENGAIKVGQQVTLLKRLGGKVVGRAEQLFVFENLKRTPADSAECGEIVAIAGLPDVDIGDTIAGMESPQALPPIQIDEPTLSMVFSVNTSPLSGKTGKFLTVRHLRDRLYKELKSNVALKVEDTDDPRQFKVSGRGLLHLSVLIENMRREGFEMEVGKPEVIYREVNGETHEPVELMTVDVPEAYSGKVMELVGQRRGVVKFMDTRRGHIHYEFLIPARGLIGLRSKLLTATRGEAVMYHVFHGYEPHKGEITQRKAGVLVSMSGGTATNYAVYQLLDRGIFFVKNGDDIYEGMIAGEHCKDRDIIVNVTRAKALTNFRVSAADATISLPPPRVFTLEEALEYLDEDELLEVTPTHLRLRKRLLTQRERKKAGREEAEVLES
ncbi:MAG: translational GTPase TypA [Planctomycetes bacterium]|nr:translational GTPase TypA [Planctomycetota bacterium]